MSSIQLANIKTKTEKKYNSHGADEDYSTTP